MKVTNLHTWPINEICGYLHTNIKTGLTSEEAARRLQISGPNSLTLPKEESQVWRSIVNSFKGLGLLMFLGCLLSILCVLHGYAIRHTIDPEYIVSFLACLTLFVVSGIVWYLLDNDDYKAINAFRSLLPKYCTVVRNGRNIIVLSANVVLGDVLCVAAGDRIAADVCFFEVNDLRVNNVALLGVSLPVNIDPKAVHQDKWISCNMGFACSHTIQGSGKGIVIACGDHTEIGLMTQLSMEPRPISRIRKHIKQLNIIVKVLIACFCFCLIIAAWLVDLMWQDCFEFLICMIIFMTPLSMPFMLAFTLLYARKRFLAKNCYVRNMEASLTLGLTSVIVSTILGTITMRQANVTEVFVDMTTKVFEKSIDLYEASDRFMELIRVAVLCNDAEFYPAPIKLPVSKRTASGSDFDVAVLEFAQNYINDVGVLRQKLPRVAYKPHNTIDHMQITINEMELPNGDISHILLIKGSYKIVLDYCKSYANNDEEVELDDDLRKFIEDEANNLELLGRYVVGFAYKDLSASEEQMLMQHDEYDMSDFLGDDQMPLRFLGFIATNDPLHPGILNAVKKCQSAGIKLVLVTRAPFHFTLAIAKQLGLVEVSTDGTSSPGVIDMKHFYQEDAFLYRYIENMLLSQTNLLFASSRPTQLHMVVEVCRNLGAVVTTIGNSLYDTPALRHSHVGVARGITSSLTTKWSADLHLLDDNFVSLIKVIEESRLIFENMKKMLAFVMSPNIAQIYSTFSFILLQSPPKVFINVSIIISMLINIASIALIYEKAEYDLMKEKPMLYDDFPFNRRMLFVIFLQVGVIQALATQCASSITMARHGFLFDSLIGRSRVWYDESINDLSDSYGQEWTFVARRELEYKTSLAFLITIIVMQAVNLVIKQTGRASLLKHGFGNWYVNLALVYLFLIGVLLCTVNEPTYFRVMPMENYDWMVFILPFVVFFIFWETMRRYLLRHFPGSWLELNTYY